MTRQDRAVTPVVSTILMVAIVVLLAATVSVFFFDITEDINEPPPNVADTTGEFVPGVDEQVVRITHVAGDSVPVEEIEIIVRASGPGDDLPTEARLVDLPAEGRFLTDNIDGNVDLINSRTSAANIIEEDSSNTWSAGKTIQFEINVDADFRDPPEDADNEADTLEVVIVHTPSNSILSEHTFTP